tara:strand:+ start:756 stop:962 length:207 start_codon:yes stop_codon:yes gene_type:complete
MKNYFKNKEEVLEIVCHGKYLFFNFYITLSIINRVVFISENLFLNLLKRPTIFFKYSDMFSRYWEINL